VTKASGNAAERERDSTKPQALIVQSDCSVLLEVHSPVAEDARAAIAPFAELVKSPEHVHTYRITPLSIWNARAAGFEALQMVAALREHARYGVPASVEWEILDLAGRYGRVVITREKDTLRCSCLDEVTAARLSRDRDAGPVLTTRIDKTSFRVHPGQRGILKQALVAAGFPPEDLAGYAAGDPLHVALRDTTVSGRTFAVRDYQRQAAEAFYRAGSEKGGSGWADDARAYHKLDRRQTVAARDPRQDRAPSGRYRRIYGRA
jgi:DNA excision repair protein ERCC-3